MQVETLWYSKLDNGHLVAGVYEIGAMVGTQWGPRRVVSHEVVSFTLGADERAEEWPASATVH